MAVMKRSGRRRVSEPTWVIAAAVVVLVVAAGLRLRADFTISRTVTATSFEGIGAAGVESAADVHVRCSGPAGRDQGAYYVSQTGETLFFNESTPHYPDPTPMCESARHDRWRSVLALALAAMVVVGVVALLGLIRTRRAEDEHDFGATSPSV